MAGDNYDISENPVYETEIKKLKTTDKAHAEEVFNPLFKRIIENIHAVKLAADTLAGTLEQISETGGETGEALNALGESVGLVSQTAQEAKTTAENALNTANARLSLSGGTMTGELIASNDTAYTTSKVRNIQAGTADLTAGTSALASGSIYVVYE